MGNKAFLISSVAPEDQPEALIVDSEYVLLCCDYSFPVLWFPMFDTENIAYEEQKGKRQEMMGSLPIPFVDKETGLKRLRDSNELVREILGVTWDFTNHIRMLSDYIEASDGDMLCIEPGEMMSTKEEREEFLRCIEIYNGERKEGFREHIIKMADIKTDREFLINPYDLDGRFNSGKFTQDDESTLFGLMGYGWYHDRFPWTDVPPKDK